MPFSTSDVVSGDDSRISKGLGTMLATTASRRQGVDPRSLNLMTMSDIFLLNKPLIPDQTSTMKNLDSLMSSLLGRAVAEGEVDEVGLNLVPRDIIGKLSARESGFFNEGFPGTGVSGDTNIGPAPPGSTGTGSSGTIHGSGEQLSENFHASEFYSRFNPDPPLPPDALPALRYMCQRILEPMREEFGEATITSGYRPPVHNNAIGGAENSRHMYGKHSGSPAVDVRFATGTSQAWYNMADRMLSGRGGVGIYSMRSIHIDNRDVYSRWDWR